MRTLRQTLEGMVLGFNPAAAADLTATIQFEVNGAEPGTYHLHIADGRCTFHTGTSEAPTLTIATPSDVWQHISAGAISGQDALMQGLYQASGDLSLLLQMNRLFKAGESISRSAPPGRRPAGPIPLRGMHWIHVGFVPWIIYWITFDLSDVSHWISIGLPFLLAGLLLGYRETFNTSTWLEKGGVVFFAGAGGLTVLEHAWFAHWGSTVGSLVMGALWLATLAFTRQPMTAAYSKWRYVKALWTNSTFLFINAAITLVWGWTFVVSGTVGVTAGLWPAFYGVLTTVRHVLLVPAAVFTARFQKGADQRRIEQIERQMERFRLWAWIGLAATLGTLLVLLISNL